MPLMVPGLGAARAGAGAGPPGAEEITTLWVGNVAQGTTDAELHSTFSEFGSLVTCFLLQKPSPNGHLSGFVRYASREEGESALQVANHGHLEINGSAIQAKWADRNSKPSTLCGGEAPAPQRAPAPAQWQPLQGGSAAGHGDEELATLWVGDVEAGTTDLELAEAFGPYGTLVAAFLTQKRSPNGQVSGFVRYSCGQEAQAALEAAEAGVIVCRSAPLVARWASRNTGITKGLADGASAPAPRAAAPSAAPSRGAAAAGFEALVAVAVRELAEENGGARLGGRAAASGQPLARAAAAAGPPPAGPGEEAITTLWFGNVEVGTTQEEVDEAFGPFGELLACFLLPKPSPNGQMSGFVRYATVGEAEAALQCAETGQISLRGTSITARWGSRNTKVSRPNAAFAFGS